MKKQLASRSVSLALLVKPLYDVWSSSIAVLGPHQRQGEGEMKQPPRQNEPAAALFASLLLLLGGVALCVQLAGFMGLPQFVWRSVNLIGIIRALRSSGPARPYIERLIAFSRLM